MTTTPHAQTTTTSDANVGLPEFSEDKTTVVSRPAQHQSPQGYNYGYGQGPTVPHYGGAFPPPYGPHHVVPGKFPAAPKWGLARVPRAAWLAAAAVVALVVILVAVIVAGSGAGGRSPQGTGGYAGSSTAAPTPAVPADADTDPAKLITSADLPKMLLNPQEIAAAVGQPANTATAKPGEVRTAPYVDALTSGQDCLALAATAQQGAYQGSGFTAARSLSTLATIPGDDARSWSFFQGMFVYPNVAAAEKALLTNSAKWKSCEGKSWSYNQNGRDYFWTAGTVENSGTLTLAWNTQENGDGWGCWRAITSAANVVADFTACGKELPQTAAAQAAAAITGKAPNS